MFFVVFHVLFTPTCALSQALCGVPADQNLLLPLERRESLLCPGEEAWKDLDGRSCRCYRQNWWPDKRSVDPQWAACLHSACGPFQLQGRCYYWFLNNVSDSVLVLFGLNGMKLVDLQGSDLQFLLDWWTNCAVLFPQLISHCILVVMSSMFPNDFSPEVHVAMDKFLSALSRALSEKFR